MIHRSPLALILLEKLSLGSNDLLVFSEPASALPQQSDDDPFEHVLTNPHVVSFPKRCPGPDHPQWKIPPSEWPTMLSRIDQGESLRQVAKDSGVSYEAIRRVISAGRKK